jgi:hypothetical protein
MRTCDRYCVILTVKTQQDATVYQNFILIPYLKYYFTRPTTFHSIMQNQRLLVQF